jgi:hypothetical protein
MKAPSANIQAPGKLQTSSSSLLRKVSLMFGVWNFSGAWCLEFGAFDLVSLDAGASHLEL